MSTNAEVQQGQQAPSPVPTPTPKVQSQTPAVDPAADAEQVTAPSFPLMQYVIWILGAALILLVVFVGVTAIQGKPSNDLNTLTSLIAGGFVGFLTPHVAKPLKNSGKSGNATNTTNAPQ